MQSKNVKGGAEKARLKRAALLTHAANDPKQLKLFSVSKILSVSNIVFFTLLRAKISIYIIQANNVETNVLVLY